MPTMTRNKKPKPGPAPAPAPQSRTGKSLQLYIPEGLMDAFDAYLEAARPRPTKTAIVVMLLEDFLRQQGALPEGGGK